jgi:hypothetical protein
VPLKYLSSTISPRLLARRLWRRGNSLAAFTASAKLPAGAALAVAGSWRAWMPYTEIAQAAHARKKILAVTRVPYRI